ncbi:Long-chain-fatty-acid--CoA ligase FadD13 [Anatilimnocola aggregata]|uniref:Long-chain-fatty-acid--CoA ligase FadD13 n=1 Tax=Anatilimnocola aggregata TaxID=2528021 RepID=A0A517YEI4_9BACT|nr:AMP-binding protein [Anatilimnocola aggregata]QDU28654.1 Long-chain-fatty-acid--CoA ligase FadD13 [Anatilimnocola aggregata]
MTRHFGKELRHTFQAHSQRTAIHYCGEAITYARLEELTLRCAGWLQAKGVQPGDRVVLFTPNKLPFLIAQLGAMFAGAVPLPLNPRFTREEMRYYLNDSGARVVIAGAEQRAMIEALVPELTTRPETFSDELALAPPTAEFKESNVQAEEACLILYSSGTTGWPKGVVHTHANVSSSLHGLAECWRMTNDDIVINSLPLFHIHGLAFATHTTLLVGGCVLIEDTFDAQRILQTIGQGTIFMAVPPIYYKLLEEPGFREAAKNWSNVRLFTCGSAPIRTEVLPELQAILGKPIINRYGMTESYVISSLPLDGPWPDGSVGLPLAGVEVLIKRTDGSLAEVGEVGAVVIRGPNIFNQYWQKPEATRAALVDGWFDTGDLGQLDERGFLTLVGRKHDLIITSGYNVYPQVVERVLGECPGVGECAVLGLPDSERGERVAAAIVRTSQEVNEQVLRNWCNDRLVHYQQPKSLIFIDALPKNALGKVLRRELRERFPNT